MSDIAPAPTDSPSKPAAAADAASNTAGAAAEQGRQVAATVSDQAKTVADAAKTQVQSVTGEARQQASRVVDDTTTELREQLEQRLTQLVASSRSTADQLRALHEGRPDEAGRAGDLVHQASDQLAHLADRAEELGVKGVADETAAFARRRPLVFLAGAAAAGLLVGRALRNARAAGDDGSDGGRPELPSGDAMSSAGRPDAAELGTLDGPTGAVTPTEVGNGLSGATVPAGAPSPVVDPGAVR